MNNLTALLITLIAGMSFWIGALITKLIKNKHRLNELAVALAFSVMLGLLIIDFIPHLDHVFASFTTTKRIINIGSFVVIGFLILKVLDLFIPDHHAGHKHNDSKEHDNHLFHIGVITSVSLMIHNLIEGLSIYNLSLTDTRSGILMALGVIMHNIPLGVSVFATMNVSNYKKSFKLLIMSLLSISSVIGAFILFLIGGEMNHYIKGVMLCITLGMVIYLTFFELFDECIHHIKSKYTLIGFLLGAIIIGLIIII